MLTAKEAATLYVLKKELCERSLHAFVKEAWHLVEPDQKFRDYLLDEPTR